jgi:hypothetical protein
MNSSASSGSGKIRWQKKMWRAGRWAGLFAFSGVLAGCQSAPLQVSIFRRDYRPDNVFTYPPKLALNVQRVAVLPLAAETAGQGLPEGCDALSPVLWEQLVKTKKFEVVAVDAGKLRSRTGRANWTGGEALPADFLAFLRREYGCDAVLFTELTAYRAYAPLAVGWRLKLVDAGSGQIIWSADELFDAAHPGVGRAAQRFESHWPVLPFVYPANWVAINSPRQFGAYSAAALLGTLPER